ncbi:hypothetical protein A2276_02510 [candidate division WOR-1 bacterium RIFOXYA12_FULL_43_27]|uniref:Polymerase/histidinol phosphatase N-terminal domain-containing protein n=1 Tax=candidate division WOR-1 bacterium RIFOXYC2_FULL_46_14 TaxID=1802587 RepID=A0A1F4U7S5_UNCSA|nr:MAG: hypothetical protein A2276_02510 [candidate division WOR-1 bacterium RIFOXYA12_FULL_43_27]OGC19416.1 MAG: hypothetical protein A2292_01820 [candidate division WOR-1 bacterium RIFOXYB2_FULL_46_45]OGC30405.1 MAG: hypothetical protein A2232_01820 [candidate division WOR-1 bacterium RIFOXYA2_FULL_46_56]OGC41005.1 MAG: hypothetical protein A2438_01820 [candidate division WOR-1 bacterium RIFOXYC2_FULL_46_14]
MSADLHVHSTYSDGTESPETVVFHAKNAGLKTIALTDHDTVDGIPEALAAGKKMGLEVIPGVEFSTEAQKAEIHILGYFINCDDSNMLDLLKKVQNDRKDRICRICEKMIPLGVSLDPEKVFKKAGNEAPGRPHVARTMVEEGLVASFNEAFDRFLDFRSPAFVPHYKLEPQESIKMIKKAGGVPVFAHPNISGSDTLIEDFVKAGLRGIEAYYPHYYEGTVNKYLEFAKKYNLIVTGGSDYHGINSGREIKLGEFTIKDELVEKLKDEHLRGN